MSYTKGPWEIKPNETIYSVMVNQKDGISIARVWIDGERKDNAALIAAAPDLLEACREIVCDLQFSEVHQHKNLVEIARKAIAKAEGK